MIEDAPRLPPLPVAGFRPPWWRVALLQWPSISVALVGALLGIAAMRSELWWAVPIVAMGVVAFAPARPRVPHADTFESSLLVPALRNGRHAFVLASATAVDGGWRVETVRVPILGAWALHGDGPTCGSIVPAVLGARFVPAAALVPLTLRPLAAVGRVPAGYFELLRESGTAGTMTLDGERARALFGAALDRPPPSAAIEHETATWCAGLPERERQPLGEAERAFLVRVARHHAVVGTLFLIHALLLPPSVVAVWLGVTHVASSEVLAAGLIGAVTWTAYAVSFRDAFLHLRLTRRLHGDLRAGSARVFSGIPIEHALADEVAMARAGLPLPDATQRRTLIVAPVSRTLLSLDGVVAERVSAVHVADVGVKGPAVEIALPGAPQLPPGIELRRRPLSATERAEIDRLVRAIRPFPRGPLLIYLACSALLFGVMIPFVTPERAAGVECWTAIWVVATLAGSAYVLIRWRRQVLLERDIALGWVVVIEHAGELVEMLPHSRAPWTERGVPAVWRRTADV